MFRWFKSDNVERIEEAEINFIRLHKENDWLKRENEALRREVNRLEGLLLRTETVEKGVKFQEGGVLYAVPGGFEFEPYPNKESNLLEIKLKDTDSVPEVWYEGRRLDELPNGLVSIDYNWKTKGHDDCFEGENNLDIEWFGTHKEGFRR